VLAVEPPHAALVVDASTGTVVHQERAMQRWYPASLTKMMTIYLTLAALERGELRPNEMLTASTRVAAQPDSRLGLVKGDRITVEQAIMAVITQSANDAAVTLAERIGGSEEAFAAKMTAQAGTLGMNRTTFKNATGLPDDAKVTTAHDMALLALALLHDFPQHYHYFGTRSFSYKGISYNSINGILGSYPGADGLKTGFTCGSGFNLVASAKRDNRRLVGVVLGAASSAERTSWMTRFLNDGFAGRGNDHGGTTLTAMQPAAEDNSPPPFRLKPSECNLGTGIRNGGAHGRLPGWGLLFGVFHDQEEARKYISQMQQKLKPVLTGGQPALLKRQNEDVVSWKALVVGLKTQDAINACLYLLKSDTICLVQSPQVLNAGVAAKSAATSRSKKKPPHP
jgi:D-alanyl-D-alanine carboxypeptidase